MSYVFLKVDPFFSVLIIIPSVCFYILWIKINKDVTIKCNPHINFKSWYNYISFLKQAQI